MTRAAILFFRMRLISIAEKLTSCKFGEASRSSFPLTALMLKISLTRAYKLRKDMLLAVLKPLAVSKLPWPNKPDGRFKT